MLPQSLLILVEFRILYLPTIFGICAEVKGVRSACFSSRMSWVSIFPRGSHGGILSGKMSQCFPDVMDLGEKLNS